MIFPFKPRKSQLPIQWQFEDPKVEVPYHEKALWVYL